MAQVVGRPYWKMCERCRVVEVLKCSTRARQGSGQRPSQTRIGLPDQISETTSYIGNNLGAFSEKKNTSNFKLSELELKTININPFFLQNMTFT